LNGAARKSGRNLAGLWLCLALVGAGTAGQAQAQVVTNKDGHWRGLIGASLAFTTGNTVTNSAVLNLDLSRQTSHSKVSVQSFINHGTSKLANRTQTTADKWGAAGQYDSDLDLRWFAFSKLRLEGDRLLFLTLRSTASAGVGYHVIDTEDHTLNAFGGLSYTDSQYSRNQLVNGRMGRHFEGPGGIVGEESTHRFNDRVSFKQRTEIYPDGSGDHAHIGRFNGSLNVSMSETLSLSLSVVSVYTHNVPPNIKKTDTALFTGINVKLEP
jgi:putative salt-induced outer membrane protein